METRTVAGAALQLDAIRKDFGGFTAVDGLSFTVAEGEIFGFLGPNGAGKTTTLRMVLDIIAPTSGRLSVLGSPSATPVRRRIGYLPEERGLYRKMRALDTIAYFARLRGLDNRDARARAHRLLEEFGLGAFARARNEALSKGMAQKVQLLATIAHDPDLLILDEPFSGLDPINQATLEALIRRLKGEGKTIIFSTHVMEHAERLCDRFLIMAKGSKRFDGSLADARAAFPAQIVVRTDAGGPTLERLPMVAAARARDTDGAANPGAEREYFIDLAADADPQSFLAAAVEAGIRLTRFDTVNASLHDIFVALAADEPPTFAQSAAPPPAPAAALEEDAA